jgi:uncharacterized membrane protein (GlpM family)
MTAMAPDTLFWFGLVLKMAMTAVIVVAASVIVERTGPFIGALIAALPTAAGAVYIILAVEHSPSFIAASAVGTAAANSAVCVFALTYAVLAQRRSMPVSVIGAFLVWFIAAALLQLVVWTPLTVVLLNAVVSTVTIIAGTRFRAEAPAQKVRATAADIAWRAFIVALCVAIVTTASYRIGSFASGVFAVFPVAMGSFFVILHPRVGGPVAASVAAHVQAPLIGLGLGFLAVHYLAEPIGVWWSYAVGLSIGFGWNTLLWMLRQRRRKV